MSRGSSSADANLKLFFMKISGLKEGEKIHIKQTEAKGDKEYVELEETINKVSGHLHKVEVREYKYKDEDKQELRVWLKDTLEGEMYCVSVGLNSIGRNIINTLLGLEQPYGELEIRVYNKKDNDMPSVYMEHNGVKTGWKYGPDEIKKYIVENKVTKKGVAKIERDYFKLDEFLLKELNEKVISHFNKTPAKFAEQPAPTKVLAEAPSAAAGDDDLPF